MKKILTMLPGIMFTAILATIAWTFGKAMPIIGAPVLGILFGLIMALWGRPSTFEQGIKFSSSQLLKYSIILLGFGMNLFNVLEIGSQTLLLMLFTLTTTFLTAFIMGKVLKIDTNTNILIGIGTAICGGSAIAATAPIINADEEEVARSISVIFLFNVLAVFVFPFVGHLLHMTNYSFGLWAGTAVNDTSSVVAVGYTYSDIAGDFAVIVKLTRTLMIVPISLCLALYMLKKEKKESESNYSFTKIFPWFVLGFILASIVNTFISLPAELRSLLTQAGKFLTVMAMTAIGLNTNVVRLLRNGLKPILLGLSCWVILSIASIIAQYVILKV